MSAVPLGSDHDTILYKAVYDKTPHQTRGRAGRIAQMAQITRTAPTWSCDSGK